MAQEEGVANKQELVLPSTRLIELETLLRQREQENERLGIEVNALRKYLDNKQAPVNVSERDFTLPPALLSLVLPYLVDPLESELSSRFSGNSVTIALTQRAKQLQEENDELYELLKHGETGRLKEEVRALRQAVRKAERALTGSDRAEEAVKLDKCYEALTHSGSGNASASDNHSISNSGARRQTSRAGTPGSGGGGGGGGSSGKPLPTGPRAQKRARMTGSGRVTPSPQQVSRGLPGAGRKSVSVSPERRNTSSGTNVPLSSLRGEKDEDNVRRERRESPRERDRDRRDYPPPRPPRDWERDRDRDRGGGGDRDGDGDRDRDRGTMGNRRGGGGMGRERDRRGGGGGGGGFRGPSNWNAGAGSGSGSGSGSRGLAERLGLQQSK